MFKNHRCGVPAWLRGRLGGPLRCVCLPVGRFGDTGRTCLHLAVFTSCKCSSALDSSVLERTAASGRGCHSCASSSCWLTAGVRLRPRPCHPAVSVVCSRGLLLGVVTNPTRTPRVTARAPHLRSGPSPLMEGCLGSLCRPARLALPSHPRPCVCIEVPGHWRLLLRARSPPSSRVIGSGCSARPSGSLRAGGRF